MPIYGSAAVRPSRQRNEPRIAGQIWGKGRDGHMSATLYIFTQTKKETNLAFTKDKFSGQSTALALGWLTDFKVSPDFMVSHVFRAYTPAQTLAHWPCSVTRHYLPASQRKSRLNHSAFGNDIVPPPSPIAVVSPGHCHCQLSCCFKPSKKIILFFAVFLRSRCYKTPNCAGPEKMVWKA